MASIPFKQGLRPEQKASIEKLALKPVGQWTATDKANWAYATNNSAPPTEGSGTSFSIAGGGVTAPVIAPTAKAPAPAPAAKPAPAKAPSQKRTLSSKERSELDAANARIQAGQGSATDRANVDYAKKNGLWSPSSAPAATATAPAPAQAAPAAAPAPKPPEPARAPPPQAQGGPPTLDSMKAGLSAIGVDVGTLDDRQVQALWGMNSVIDQNAEKDRRIAPVQNTAAEWASFMDQASREMDPYYQELFQQARQDLTQQMGVITGEFDLAQQQQAEAFRRQQEDADIAAAEAGLAQSGIRARAEEKMSAQQKGIVESGRRSAQSQLYGLGSAFERRFGTAGLGAAGVPMLAAPGYPTLGVGQRQLGYMPLGVGLGDVGRERKAATTGRAQELAGQSLGQKYGLSYGLYPSNLSPSPVNYPKL